MRRAASRADWTAGRSSPTRMAMTEITTRSSIRVKPWRPDHRHRYPDMAPTPEAGRHPRPRALGSRDPRPNRACPWTVHQTIDSSNPGIMKVEVVTGDSRPSAGGAADAAVRKRNAAGSALVDSSDSDGSNIDAVRWCDWS